MFTEGGNSSRSASWGCIPLGPQSSWLLGKNRRASVLSLMYCVITGIARRSTSWAMVGLVGAASPSSWDGASSSGTRQSKPGDSSTRRSQATRKPFSVVPGLNRKLTRVPAMSLGTSSSSYSWSNREVTVEPFARVRPSLSRCPWLKASFVLYISVSLYLSHHSGGRSSCIAMGSLLAVSG